MAASLQKVASRLREMGAQFLRVSWCCNANVVRSKAVYYPHLEGALKEGVALCTAVQVHCFFLILGTI